MAWRIRDWDRHFENHKTRILRRVLWVAIPNKLDGDGFTFLMDHADGAAHYGAWLALVLIASKCDPRGWLVRDELRAGDFRRTPPEGGATLKYVAKIPHSIDDLARLSRIAPNVLRAAIPRLMRIGWLEEIPRKSLTSLAVASRPPRRPKSGVLRRTPAGCTRARAERNGTVKKCISDVDVKTGADAKENARPDSLLDALAKIGPLADWDSGQWNDLLPECRELADRLPGRCRPLGASDENEIVKICALQHCQVIPADWVAVALSRANQRSTKKPMAILHATLAAQCADAGINLNRLFKAIAIPQRQRR